MIYTTLWWIRSLLPRADAWFVLEASRNTVSRSPAAAYAATTLASLLNRRARHVAVGAVDAAVTLLRAKQGAAAGALVEELTGIGRHRFRCTVPAVRTGQGRSQFHQAVRSSLIRAGSKVPQVAAATMRRVARLRSTRAPGDRREAVHDPSGLQVACGRRA